MNRPWVYALVCCAAAAFLENVFAGPGVRRQMQEIRVPRFAAPFWGWIAIGLAYYVMAFSILRRLFELPVDTQKTIALVLVALVLFLNGFWNLFFFRRRQFGAAFIVSLVYSALAVGLLVLLWSADRPAALILLPYVLYLAYANGFGYWVWQLNRDGQPSTSPR